MPIRRRALPPAAAALLAARSCAAGTAFGKFCVALPSPAPVYDPVAGKDEAHVTFLAVGGVIRRWQGRSIMTAPLYSNPPVAQAVPGYADAGPHVDRSHRGGKVGRPARHPCCL